MRIRLKFDSLKETKPMEYVIRFAFGGVVTVLAGLVADTMGQSWADYSWRFQESSRPA